MVRRWLFRHGPLCYYRTSVYTRKSGTIIQKITVRASASIPLLIEMEMGDKFRLQVNRKNCGCYMNLRACVKAKWQVMDTDRRVTTMEVDVNVECFRKTASFRNLKCSLQFLNSALGRRNLWPLSIQLVPVTLLHMRTFRAYGRTMTSLKCVTSCPGSWHWD